jgi:hypothetical protein
MLTTELRAQEKKISASAAAGDITMLDGEEARGNEEQASDIDDDVYLNQLPAVDAEALQMQLDHQLQLAAAGRRRQREDAARRAHAVAHDHDDDDDDDDDDDSRAGEAVEARERPRDDGDDDESEIGNREGFGGISAADFLPQHEEEEEEDADAAIQPQKKSARKEPVKQPLKQRKDKGKAADTSRLRPSERKVRTLPTSRQLAVRKHEAAMAKWEAEKAKWAKKPEHKNKQYHVPKPALAPARRGRGGCKLNRILF